MVESPQILLDLDPRRPDRLEDFVVGPNTAVVSSLRQLLVEPGHSVFLYGPPGSGKSHLLNGLCHEARDRNQAAFYLGLKHVPGEAASGLAGLQGFDLVCIDDIHLVAGKAHWEESLFHCFNQVREASGRLLISSARPLSQLSFDLPDLASRLAWGTRQVLQMPSDEERLTILQRRSQSLQLSVPEEVFSYLLRHGKRDTASLVDALEQMRERAFEGKRRITIPLARSVLEQSRRSETC